MLIVWICLWTCHLYWYFICSDWLWSNCDWISTIMILVTVYISWRIPNSRTSCSLYLMKCDEGDLSCIPLLVGLLKNFQECVILCNVCILKPNWHTTINTIRMMTSSKGNIFRVTGHLGGESTGNQWIPLTKASDEEIWCFIWSAPEQLSKQLRRRWFETPLRSLWRHRYDRDTNYQPITTK